MEKLVETLWRRGVDVSPEDVRKWLQPFGHVENPEEIAAVAASISEKTGKDWFAIVAINQTMHMFGEWEKAKEYMEKLAALETSPVVPIITWRAGKIDPEFALSRRGEAPGYIASTESITDFFKNVYRYEGGVDLGAVENMVKSVVENEDVDEFFRLVDIDKPVEPEEFVKRVNKAVEVLSLAKEQGLDVKKILREWDRLADEGGERLEKLSRAVKAVAEDVVKQRFWDEVKEHISTKGVRVFDGEIPEDVLGVAYYLDMVEINGSDVDITPMSDYLDVLAEIMSKAKPIPMYRLDEIEDLMRRTGIDMVETREELEFIASVLARLSKRALKVFVEGDVWRPVTEACIKGKREGKSVDDLVDTLDHALVEVYRGNMAGEEEVAQFIEKKLFS